MNRCLQDIGEGQHTYVWAMGSFHESTSLLQQESQTYCYIKKLLRFFHALRISCFGERFRDGQYSLVTFLFFCYSTLGAPVPSHLYNWGHVTPYPMELAPLSWDSFAQKKANKPYSDHNDISS